MDRDYAALEAWLGRLTALGAANRIVSVARPRSGFSADTLMLDVANDGTTRSIVIRSEQAGRHTFLGSDIARQARMMTALAAHGVPAPVVLGWEADPAVIGGSFLAMERIAGQALPQHPSYHVAGLLPTLDERQRREGWLATLAAMAGINRLDWSPEFAFLHDPRFGPPGLDNYLGWLAAWRDEACGGRPHQMVDAAIARLIADRPDGAAVELLWGDANPGNFLFDDAGRPVAVLDFEAAAIGPAEIDLSWWFFIDAMLADGQPAPAGIPTKAEQIAVYEAALGREVVHLDYYEILSAVRMALVMARIALLLTADGILPADSDAWRVNPATARLADLTDRPARSDMAGYWQMVALMNAR